jgi:hypothetical protein
MKRIISVLLMLACLVALCSCGGGVGDFEKALGASKPASVKIDTVSVSSLGTLNGSYQVIYNEDGSAKMLYEYEKWNTELNDEGDKKTVSGTINVAADGSYTNNDVAGNISDLASGNINLSAIKGATVENGKLTAIVAAADTEAVFGVAFDYDINFEMNMNETSVETIKLSYEKDGFSGSITCVYTY